MPIKSVNSETLKKWLANNEAVVVDVREPAEHQAEKITGAQLVPLSTVCVNNLPQHQGKKLVVHCRSGKRGSNACEKLLAENDGLEIYNLEGGISAWAGSGNKTECFGKFFLPLDRQVQLCIGSTLLVGSFLTYFIHPLFILLPTFLGAGLTFAGLTGYCGLAMFLAKMPWNQCVDKNITRCSVK